MGNLRWYKRDPRAALVGMARLTLEERGAYNTLLDLLYIHDGNLDDDPEIICRWLKCRSNKWRRIRARLIDMEKLYLCGGKLRNERTDHELGDATRRIHELTQKASNGGKAKAAKLRIIAGLDRDKTGAKTGVTPTIQQYYKHKPVPF